MPDQRARLSAALEGQYRIERQLGEGGMATVCLAEDVKHERKVALKVLKAQFAAAVGAERFLVEIKTTANLQHPHILPLFDSRTKNPPATQSGVRVVLNWTQDLRRRMAQRTP